MVQVEYGFKDKKGLLSSYQTDSVIGRVYQESTAPNVFGILNKGATTRKTPRFFRFYQ
jgi:hypothetical protein